MEVEMVLEQMLEEGQAVIGIVEEVFQ